VTIGQNLLAGVNSPTTGTLQTNYFNRTAQRDQSLYAQEQILTLSSRLALTAGITAERSTLNGDIGKLYSYPRYSGSYRIPEFVPWIDQLKVRLAYGQSGNLAPYGAKYTPYQPTQEGGLLGIFPNSQNGDANIKPEAQTEIETGIDATFFKSRMQFSGTIYQKRLTDLLLLASVAPSLGHSTEYINGGEFTNQGIELSLTGTPIQLSNGFSWISTVTYFRNYSVVNSLPPSIPPGPIGGSANPFGSTYLQPGRSVSEIVNTNILNSQGQPIQVGDFQPSYRMSFSEEFAFKGFRLYGLVEWSRGGSVINLSNLYFDTGPGLWADSAQAANRIKAYNNGLTPYVESASFVKLRQLSLSYTAPQWVTRKVLHGRFTSAKLSLTGYNLFSWFPYTGLDPEVSFDGNQTVAHGEDITPYPPSRSYFVGLTLGL